MLAVLALAVLAATPTNQALPREQRVVALRQALEAAAESGFSGAVLVAEGDDVLLDAACGLADRAHGVVNRPDTIFDIGSITKQFTATAVLQLEQRGKLATSDTLERFFEGVPDDKRKIQLHHLLTHTSGLPSDLEVGRATTERADLVGAALHAKPQSKPGEKFVYNNLGYMLLGAVVEIASGQPFEAYVTEHLFAPAGMKSSGFLRTSGIDAARTARGYEAKIAYGPAENGWYSWGLRGAGGVLSTTGDLLRWSMALQGKDILSSREREKLFTPFLLDYAYGWWVRDDPRFGRVIAHGGTTRGFEAQLAHYAEHDLRVIVLCNDRGRGEAFAHELAGLATGLRAAHTSVALSQSDLEAFAGKYEVLRGGTVTVRVDGEALVLVPDVAAVTGLLADGGSTKLETNARLAQRAEKLIDFLAAGDAEGAQALLSKQWPGWNRQMVKVWSGWLDQRGKLERVECLGSLGSSCTLVRLVHERRSVIWGLDWKDDVLNHWSVDGGLPENAHYRASSDAEFRCQDDERAGSEFVLTFERGGSGPARSWLLTAPSVRLSARRAR